MKYLTICAAVIATALCSTFCAAPKDKWDSLLDKYADSTEVNQLVFVKCTGGDTADVSFYVRNGEKWDMHGEESGWIGRNGFGKEKEGDGKTPLGEFGVGKAFGILPDPGTTLEYIHVTSSIFACDEDCEYYNTIIDTAEVHHACKGEDMSRIKGYNYGFQIMYNPDNVPGLDSNIFFHCGSGNTSGCVAVSEEFCREIVARITSGARVCIYEK